MNYVHLVAVVAMIQFFYFGIMVGRARVKYGVDAPATSGHEMFDRAFRIQMNTLELMVCFLPALLLADVYWPGTVIAAIGAVYIVGRFLYARSYNNEPSTRALGFLLSVLPTFTLMGAVGLGAVMAR